MKKYLSVTAAVLFICGLAFAQQLNDSDETEFVPCNNEDLRPFDFKPKDRIKEDELAKGSNQKRLFENIKTWLNYDEKTGNKAEDPACVAEEMYNAWKEIFAEENYDTGTPYDMVRGRNTREALFGDVWDKKFSCGFYLSTKQFFNVSVRYCNEKKETKDLSQFFRNQEQRQKHQRNIYTGTALSEPVFIRDDNNGYRMQKKN